MSMVDLRSRCSRYFTFADLIECGETWAFHRRAGTPISNLPVHDETYDGIARLAQNILDPLREEFGELALTYAFAGPTLTKHIKRRISPPHDQHAGSELAASGRLICERLGQSCDLRVPGRSAFEVARFVRECLPFDRLYLYGKSNALHVSYGPEQAGKIYAMAMSPNGRVPREVSKRTWDEVTALLISP